MGRRKHPPIKNFTQCDKRHLRQMNWLTSSIFRADESKLACLNTCSHKLKSKENCHEKKTVIRNNCIQVRWDACQNLGGLEQSYCNRFQSLSKDYRWLSQLSAREWIWSFVPLSELKSSVVGFNFSFRESLSA